MVLRALRAGLIAAAMLPGLAIAQETGRPAFKLHRFDEDWRGLCNPAQRTALFDPLKCIPLGPDAYLTLGGELRERFEGVRNPGFGLGQSHDHVFLHRALLHVDLHVRDTVRLFTQFGIFGQTDRVGGRSPTDVDRLDLIQGFLDVSLALGDARLTARGGRQEMTFGSSRLIGVRDSPNARRAFDGGRAFVTAGGYRLDALYVRPVMLLPDTFDDRTNKSEQLWGFYGTGPVTGPLKADLYFLGFERDRGRFAVGAAREERQTLGMRLFGNAAGFDWDIEGVVQFGSFGGQQVRAWTVASTVGFTFETVALKPRLGLKADIASGDGNLRDGHLGTFNALYPKLPYFSEANLVAPANIIDVHPSVQLQLSQKLSVELGWNPLWRHTTADAIYAPPLSPIGGTAGRRGKFIGHQAIAGFAWKPLDYLTLEGQYVHFEPGGALQRVGGRTTDFVFVSASFKF